jgi:hypothetical protein
MVLGIWIVTCRRMKADPYLPPCKDPTQNGSKTQNHKATRRKQGKCFRPLHRAMTFLDMNSKVQVKRKTDKGDYIELESCCQPRTQSTYRMGGNICKVLSRQEIHI